MYSPIADTICELFCYSEITMIRWDLLAFDLFTARLFLRSFGRATENAGVKNVTPKCIGEKRESN